MKVPIFKQSLVATLWSNIEANYDLYAEGDFADFLAMPELQGQCREVNNLFVRTEDFINLTSKSGGENDAHNANIIINAFENMNPNNAYDERIWVAATHTYGLQFTRERWLNPKLSREKNIKSIRAHFFARVDGLRGIHRNNSLSSLWWYAHVVKRTGEKDFSKRLLTFLKETDLRANIMERPSSSRTPQVFEALVSCVIQKLESDPGTTFFNRKRISGEIAPYRKWMMKINLWGGKHLYNAHTVDDLQKQFTAFMIDIEKETIDLK